jgi:chromosome segregation ATPase
MKDEQSKSQYTVPDLPLLIEGYKKEIWEWKQKESQWIKDKNQLEGHKRIVEELSTKIVEIGKVNLILKAKVNELEGTLGSAQDTNDNHQRYNGKLQREVTELQSDNKKLSKQINDYIKNHEDSYRKAGL